MELSSKPQELNKTRPSSRKDSSRKLLENKDVSRWYHNVSRGAEVTADTYIRRLNAFLRWANKSPMELASVDEGDLYNMLLDFVTYEEKRGMAGSFIQSTIKAVKSWLSHNGVFMKRKIKIKGEYQTPTLVNERTPTKEELRKIILQATSRDRISCILMAHTGVRPEVIGNYKGTDGLMLKDLPEMRIEGNTVKFDKVPTMVVIRPELSKTGMKYFSFLSEEGCDYVRIYLEERMRNGEKLGPDSDLVSPKWSNKKFVRSLNISDGIRTSIRKAGFHWRPYVLRAYCDTRLLMAESKKLMVFSYRQFLMGHQGTMEARYTTNKGKLPEDLIEDIRTAYKSSQQFLQTNDAEEISPDERRYLFRAEILRLVGMKDSELLEMDIKAASDKDIMEQLMKRLAPKSSNNNSNKQMVVSADELKTYLEQGWLFEHQLSQDKIIIKSP